ncbi:YesL family protein [Ornithinibacillus californiensis]|uniref:YesL family protein n=1 Tax=Ornithinibacillus californiensis TaxID=161536 RepID=UPI00064E0919|nr:YesL family protein [Ornithinibacillus californiensis]
MELTGWRLGLYKSMDWAMKLAYVNFLWFLGILVGLIVGGFFPSTIAMFAVIRKWLQGDKDLPTFSYFKSIYRQEFVNGNMYGFIWLILGFIIYFDLQFFRSFNEIWSLLLTYFTFIIGAIYILSLLFAFPVFVHFNVSPFQNVKNSIFLVLSRPFVSILMGICFYIPYYVLMKIPGLIPFFSGSLIGFCLVSVSLKIFESLKKDNK